MVTALMVQANSLSPDAALANGTGTYIVAFNDNNGHAGVMGDHISTFAAENNAQVLDRYNLINAVAIRVPSMSAAENLSRLPGVRYVEKDATFRATMERSAPQMGAPVAWDSSLTGKGVTVCVIDTGIDGNHPDLKDKIVGWKDIVTGRTTPYDDFGHGTHCAGIIAGTGAASGGRYRGIAPEANLIGVKVLRKDGTGQESEILAGIQYAADSSAQVISMSLGSGEHSQAICEAVSKAVRKGKIVVVAAGNSGPGSKTIGCPGDNKDAITVGAVDNSDRVCSFSSRGPLTNGMMKPDVTAPGHQIISCRAAGIKNDEAIGRHYLAMSGTSMACPMVAGTVALMVQKDPTLTEPKVKDILQKTAKQPGARAPNGDYGCGRVCIKDVIAYMDGKWKAPTPTPTPGPSPVLTPGPGNPGFPSPGMKPTPKPGLPAYPGFPSPGIKPTPKPGLPAYPGVPSPGMKPTPKPGLPAYPGFPSPGMKPTPKSGLPIYPGPGYPSYPGYPFPQFPGYNTANPGSPGNPYPGYPMF